MPDGSAPSWDTVRSRYWKNRHQASKGTGEFNKRNMRRMRRGAAPQDFNPRTGKWESRELAHVKAQRHGGPNNLLNIRELTPDWHGETDVFRHTKPTTRGLR